MARLFTSASSESYKTTGTPVTVVPFTMACWAKFTNTGNNHQMMGIHDSVVGQFHSLEVLGSNNRMRARSGDTVTNGASANTTAITTGTWLHAAGVWSATNSRLVYRNGTAGTANTTNVAFSSNTLDMVTIGDGNGLGFMNGDIAEACIWNVALTAAEITLLANGVNPLMIRRSSVVFYKDLIRDVDRPGLGLPFTTVTGTTVSTHPRIYSISGPLYNRKVTSAASPLVVPSYRKTRALLGVGR